MRAFATAAGMFALVLAVLLAAVGQLGKIDRQTLAHTHKSSRARPASAPAKRELSPVESAQHFQPR